MYTACCNVQGSFKNYIIQNFWTLDIVTPWQEHVRFFQFSILSDIFQETQRHVYQANSYLFKFNNRNTRKRCKICSKWTITVNRFYCSFWTYCWTPFSSAIIVDFEQVNVSWAGPLKNIYDVALSNYLIALSNRCLIGLQIRLWNSEHWMCWVKSSKPLNVCTGNVAKWTKAAKNLKTLYWKILGLKGSN